MSSFKIIASAVLFLSSACAYNPTNKYIGSSKLNVNSPKPSYNPTPSIYFPKVLAPFPRYTAAANNKDGNILAVLKQNGLTTFVDLIIQAGLEETFSQPRSFIVWAPTNEAFAAIGRETLNYILDDVNLLKDILTYHLGLFLQPFTLIPSIKDELTLPTVQGEVVRINVYREKGSSFATKKTVTVNGALVVNTLPAGDSIIYVIDRVLNPQDLNIRNTKIDYLRRNPEFSIFLSLYDILGLAENSFKNPMKTVFVPTNAAFLALPDGELEALLANEQAMANVINTHTASGTFYSRGLVSGPLPVFSGVNVEINVSPGVITVENANVIKVDITTFDVVIYVIDAVISSSVGNSTISNEFRNIYFIKKY